MDTIEERIANYIAENILFSKNGYPYPLDATFAENGLAEVNVLELVLFVEENFPIQVQDDEIVPENFGSVERIANYARSNQ